MLRYGNLNLRQNQLFPRGGHGDPAYRKQLKYTEVYRGTLPSYDELLAKGEKVTLFPGQTRSDDPAVEVARFETAMVGMSPNTKLIFLADCAATKLPPPCRLHSMTGRNRLPWREAVTKLVAAGVIPHPWRAADSSVHVDYTGQLFCPKVGKLMGSEVGNDGRRETSVTAHRARVHLGRDGAPPSTTDQADYMFVRWQRIIERAVRLGLPIPGKAQVMANPDFWEPHAKQPTLADRVICASCLGNVASEVCGGLVMFPHSHTTGVGLIGLVCGRRGFVLGFVLRSVGGRRGSEDSRHVRSVYCAYPINNRDPIQ